MSSFHLSKQRVLLVALAFFYMGCSHISNTRKIATSQDIPQLDDLARVTQALLKNQKPDGHWDGTLISSPLAEVILYYTSTLVDENKPPLTENLLARIFQVQNPTTRFWSEFPGGPADHSVTGVTLYGLRAMGITESDPRIAPAWKWFQQGGGLAKVKPFLRLILITDPSLKIKLPLNFTIDPELLARKRNVNILNIGAMRTVLIPLIVWKYYKEKIEKNEPVSALSQERRISAGAYFMKKAPDGIPTDEFFAQEGLAWTLTRLQADGTGLGVSLSSYVYAAALYQAQQAKVGDFSKELRLLYSGVKSFQTQLPNGQVIYSAGGTSIWDTAQALRTLSQIPSDLGIVPRRNLLNSFEYLMAHPSGRAQEWQQKGVPLTEYSWGFVEHSYANSDFDDTGQVVHAMAEIVPQMDKAQKERAVPALKSSLQWLYANQNKDGGFGAWDKNISKVLKFAGAFHIGGMRPYLVDTSQEDITARMARTFATVRQNPEFSDQLPQIDRALEKMCHYLKREVKPQITYVSENGKRTITTVPLWNSFWFINYLYGTSAVLMAMVESKCIELGQMVKSLSWFAKIQNSDGGWGESPLGDQKNTFYQDSSSIAQTGWALEVFLFYELRRNKENQSLPSFRDQIEKAISFLMQKTANNDFAYENRSNGVLIPGQWHANWTIMTQAAVINSFNMYRQLLLKDGETP